MSTKIFFKVYEKPEELSEMINDLEQEYAYLKLLPIQDDFSSGFAWAIFNGRIDCSVGVLLSKEDYIQACRDLDTANELTEEDIATLEKAYQDAADENIAFGRFFHENEPDGVLTSFRFAEMLPITREQFEEVKEANFDRNELQDRDWVRELISTWAEQACYESGSENPKCPVCGSRAWTVQIINSTRWTGPMAVHEGKIVIAFNPETAEGKVEVGEMHCSLCNHHQDGPDLPVHVTPPE